jgi:hypothetical protein
MTAKRLMQRVCIEQHGPEDKTVPAVIDDGEVHEAILDEADDFGDIDEEGGMSIQDIDEIEDIKEEA